MTPNGRRRWRRRAKAWRLAERGFGSTVYTPRTSNALGIARNGAFDRRHRRTFEAYSAAGEYRQLWVDTQRAPLRIPASLVGMSQRARRGFAHAEAGRRWDGTPEGRAVAWAEARKRFRVGQRLVACGGCPACQPDPHALLILPSFCDGSGVC